MPLKGNRISIYNIVGRVHVTGSGSSPSATITQRGRDATKLKIVDGNIDGRESLRIVIPMIALRLCTIAIGIFAPSSESATTAPLVALMTRAVTDARGRAGGNRSVNNMRVSDDQGGLDAAADIEVQVPHGASLRVNVGAGDVVVNNVNRDLAVDVHAANVAVSDVKGVVDLDVGSGHSDVSNIAGSVMLDVGSGRISLAVPRPIDHQIARSDDRLYRYRWWSPDN